MISIIEAIISINPNAEVSVNEENYETIQWHNGTTPISKSDIEAKIVELQAEYDANQYQRNRAKEYPSIVDQLDDIYHNGIDAWKTRIAKVKSDNPKE